MIFLQDEQLRVRHAAVSYAYLLLFEMNAVLPDFDIRIFDAGTVILALITFYSKQITKYLTWIFEYLIEAP